MHAVFGSIKNVQQPQGGSLEIPRRRGVKTEISGGDWGGVQGLNQPLPPLLR